MNDIIKTVKSLEDSGFLLKGVTETVQNEVKEQKEDFLVCCQVQKVQVYQKVFLTGRRINRARKGRGINRAGGRVIRAGYGSRSSKMDF